MLRYSLYLQNIIIIHLHNYLLIFFKNVLHTLPNCFYYKQAWSWAVKAVYELRDKSCNILKLLVVSHTIRVSSVLNKLSTGKKLIDQLHTYDKKVDQNFQVDMILNKACYKLKADLAKDSIHGYYVCFVCRIVVYTVI